MVFMTSLSQKNVEDFDVDVLKILVGAFGKDRVNASLVLALSHADWYQDDLPHRVTVWLRKLYEIISEVSGLDILAAATIPAVAISNGNLDGRKSIEELWLLLLSRGGVGSRTLLRAVGREF